VSPRTPSLWSRLSLSRSALLAHRACSGKLFPGLNLWLGNDYLITSSFVLVPFESLEQAFLIFRRSKLADGDYNTSLVITGLDMLEIGARQLNDWRLHRLPDVLPFCQPGVLFNTPIFSLAATSSLPTTGSVQQPIVSAKQPIVFLVLY